MDDETRATLIEMKKLRNEVMHTQHTPQLKEVTKDLSDVLQVSVFWNPSIFL